MLFSRTVAFLIAFGAVILTVSQVSAVSITPAIDPPSDLPDNLLLPGGKVVLHCAASPGVGKKVVWKWQPDPNRDETILPTDENVAIVGDGTITISNLNGKNGGKYICQDSVDASDKQEYFVNVLDENSLIPRHAHMNGTEETVILQCDQRLAKKYPLYWMKNNGTMDIILNNVPKEDKRFLVEGAESGFRLVIKNKDRKRRPLKTGDYVCQLNLAATQQSKLENLKIRQTVQYTAKPDVRIEGVANAGKSKSCTKGEACILTCVLGTDKNDEPIHLVWSQQEPGTNSTKPINTLPFEELPPCEDDATKKCVGNFTLSRNVKLENESAANEQNERTLVLEWQNVQDDDRGSYVCTGVVTGADRQRQAFDLLSAPSSTVELKVKDKLAALWPFLGIVAEVVLLCAIIFIYEKRRNKAVEEEEEAEPMKGEVHETRDVSVRSRK